ncbi:hypothetical protein AB0P07_18370 [Streptomyces sp. NPDC085944]|uniref:hypothetical protein n=1 Tax=Streptomyces sp. NPDC085944 TaxID=3154962 RepID=UPI003444F14B
MPRRRPDNPADHRGEGQPASGQRPTTGPKASRTSASEGVTAIRGEGGRMLATMHAGIAYDIRFATVRD